MTFRDAHIRSQGVSYRGKDVKAATQEDIDKLEAKMLKGGITKATSARTRVDLGQAMVSAAAASSGDGGDREIFQGVGLAAQQVPDIKVRSTPSSVVRAVFLVVPCETSEGRGGCMSVLSSCLKRLQRECIFKGSFPGVSGFDLRLVASIEFVGATK